MRDVVAALEQSLGDNPMVDVIDQPGVGSHLAPGIPLALGPRATVARAPVLGEHTAEVLASALGLSADTIADLTTRGVVR